MQFCFVVQTYFRLKLIVLFILPLFFDLTTMKTNAAISLGLSLIISVLILASSYLNRNQATELIKVTGLGKKDFTSDLIVWDGTFSALSLDLQKAYEKVKNDKALIQAYLKEAGIAEDEILFSAININKEYNYSYDQNGRQQRSFIGHRLTQKVEIESKEVNKVEETSRKITELINQGVELYSNSPRYYYTQLTDLKIEMIAAATQDATLRAEQIAKNAKADLGELKQARMGIFQIIGQNSNEDYSWGGTFNTTSKMKTATITMKLEFEVD